MVIVKLERISFVYKNVSFVAPGIKSISTPSDENTQVKGNDTGHNHFIYHSFDKELKKEGKTIICVTHDEKMAKSADRIIDLKKERGSEK